MKDVIPEIVAEMFAASALRGLRVSCSCERPEPGVWSVDYWTTCQSCQKQLSRLAYIEKEKP
jgi:hypothetical protein